MKRCEMFVFDIGDYKIYQKASLRGWAVTIMPINLRIDNFHNFPHIHYSLKGEHVPIKVNDMNIVIEIVKKDILENGKIYKEKLKGELS